MRSLGRSDFQTMSILFKAAQALAMRILTSCFVELTSLPRYVKDSTALIGSPEFVCMVPCWLKLMCKTKVGVLVKRRSQYIVKGNAKEKRG